MKNNPLTAILLGVLAASAVASVVLCMIHTRNTREIRALQLQVAAINSRQSVLKALVGETLEYSKTHPSIDPLLEQAGLKRPAVAGSPAPAAAASTAAPTAKPPTH